MGKVQALPNIHGATRYEVILRLLSIWRVVFGLVAAGAAMAPWIGFLPGLRLWQGVLLSGVLGVFAVLSLLAGIDIARRRHRGRTLSLLIDYLAFVACLIAVLQVGGVFTAIDSLAEVFARNAHFLVAVLFGYLLGAAGDHFTGRRSVERLLRRTGTGAIILSGLAFLVASNPAQGVAAFVNALARPAGIAAITGLVVFGMGLWAMWREPSAAALKAKTGHEHMLSGWLFLSPNLLGFLIFFAGPLLLSFYLSFTDSDAVNPPRWVGLENYARILNVTIKPLASPDQLARDVLDINVFDEVGRVRLGKTGFLFGAQDRLFWLSLRNTFAFALITVPLSVVPALLLANALNTKLPGMKFFRALYFIPSIAAVVGIALVWQWLYNATIGYINYFITRGIDIWNLVFRTAIADPRIQWVSDERTALLAVILIAAWQTMGFNTVLFLAGLQNIPRELYEAATVDGAGAVARFLRITIPMLAPSTFFVVSTTTIQAMQVFEHVFILMNPPEGPNNSTITLVLYLYRSAFQNFRQGYASALAWVLFVVIFGLTLIQFQRQRRSSIYEG